VSKIAAELGNTGDRDIYRARADALKVAINGQLLDATGVYVDGLSATATRSTHVSQHANMFPLALGIVPSAQFGSVIAKVEGLHMSVGMVTVWWLVRALGEADRGPALVELFTNTNNLGWARCLSRGATATWESWSADAGSDSQSHPWGAAGLYGFVRYILGVMPLLPQYQQVRIKPLDFQTALTAASGRVPTDRGDITVAWDRDAARFFMTVNIPVNVSAVVYVPKAGTPGPSVRVDKVDMTGTEEGGYVRVNGIGSGTHTFERVATPS
jgi:alpha-L-rhamnosidase